jgi:hypothetical protein
VVFSPGNNVVLGPHGGVRVMLADIADDQLVVFYVYGPFTYILLKAMKLFKRKESKDCYRKMADDGLMVDQGRGCKLDKDLQRQ